ncbi:MAG: hypothetical protein ACRYFX_01015 [Janthinobacterium lividum]
MKRPFITALYLLPGLLLLPATALAHGEEILLTLLILPVSLVVFLLIILVVRLPYGMKGILTAVFLLATALTWATILPRPTNFEFDNWLVAGVPAASTLVAYVVVRAWQAIRSK